MAAKLFASIVVGSAETDLKIYEVSARKGFSLVDTMSRRIDLGIDAYERGILSTEKVERLVETLTDFKNVMDGYRVDSYRMVGTSAFREMRNSNMVLAQIEQETGIHIDILENTEQRFMDYKSAASKGEVFNHFLEQSTAIVDIGGGSIQISLFEKDKLSATQNMRLGVLRLREQLARIGARSVQNESLIEELVNTQLNVFKKLYLKHRDIKQIVVIDDYLSDASRNGKNFTGAGRMIQGAKGQAEFFDTAALSAFIEGLKDYNSFF